MNFIKRWIFKRKAVKELEKIKKRSDFEEDLDILLKESMKDYNRLMREAEKSLRLKELERRKRELSGMINDEEDEEDEEDEDGLDWEAAVSKNLTNALTSKLLSGQQQTPTEQAAPQEPPATPQLIMEKFNSLPPEEQEIIREIAKKKGLL